MVTTSRLFSPPGSAGGVQGSYSSSSPGNKKRNLAHPSESSSWSVEVVSAVPKNVHAKASMALSGSVNGKWACLVHPKGLIQVWQVKTSNLSEALEPPQEMITLFVPEFLDTGTAANEGNPVVALTDTGNQNSVHLWALDPASGWLVTRKIFRKDLQSSNMNLPRTTTGPSAKTRFIDNPALMTNDQDGVLDDDEKFQNLICQDSTIVVCTSKGKMFWVTYTAVPPALHLQKVEATSSSFWNRVFGSSRSTSDTIAESMGKPCHVLPMSSTASKTSSAPSGPDFLSLSTHAVIKWSVQQRIVNSGHHASFHPVVKGLLAGSFLESTGGDWILQKILHSALSLDEKTVHCIVHATSNEGTIEDESRVYWIVADLDDENEEEEKKSFIIATHWMDRFASADRVAILGMVSCENGIVYTAISEQGTPAVILTAMVPGEEMIVEEVLSKREVPSLLPGMIDRDVITHGCYMVASTGIGIRARFIQQSSNNKRPRLAGGEAPVPTSRGNQSRIKTLISHLRTFFWKAYSNPNDEQTMPPSLRHANPADLEQVLFSVALELQKRHRGNDPQTAASTAVQWHTFYVDLIQQCGLYRSLTEDGKWKIFGIGQEIAVFAEVAHVLKNESSAVADAWSQGLKSHRIADWLKEVQSDVLQSDSLSEELWHKVLYTAMGTILSYREELAESRYDITSNHPQETLWTSHPSMLHVLSKQVESWKIKQKSGGIVPRHYVEPVVKATLVSYSEAYTAVAARTDGETLEQINRLSIQVLRNANDGDDHLAFDLCVLHGHFHGICEISVHNEKTHRAKDFALDPLFSTINTTDLRSGFTFPQFVLQWHADRDLLGHVVNYGRHSPDDLKKIMNDSEKMRSYQWIPAIRQGFFGPARDLFIEQARSDPRLKSTEWSLSMAKLTNRLVANQNSQTARGIERSIEQDMEVLNAQKRLLGVDTAEVGSESEEKKSPDKLVELAVQKLGDSFTLKDRTYYAMIALNVVNAMSSSDINNDSVFSSLSRVWAECLLLDLAKWSNWALDTYDLAEIREEALNETVFGNVLEECRRSANMGRVTYGKHIEASVIDRVQDDDNRESFTRLLRTIAAPSENLRAESLMVSSF